MKQFLKTVYKGSEKKEMADNVIKIEPENTETEELKEKIDEIKEDQKTEEIKTEVKEIIDDKLDEVKAEARADETDRKIDEIKEIVNEIKEEVNEIKDETDEDEDEDETGDEAPEEETTIIIDSEAGAGDDTEAEATEVKPDKSGNKLIKFLLFVIIFIGLFFTFTSIPKKEVNDNGQT